MHCDWCHGAGGRVVWQIMTFGTSSAASDARPQMSWVANWVPCAGCIGGVASCCDTSGEGAPIPREGEDDGNA